MATYDTYSKRLRKLERAGEADVFTYDDLPMPFRVQVIHIWKSSTFAVGREPREFRRDDDGDQAGAWSLIHSVMARELGVDELADRYRPTPFDKCQFFLRHCSVIEAIDLIELSFKVIESVVAARRPDWDQPSQTPTSAIAELNARFLEHAIGYEYLNSLIIRKDCQFLHAEVVKPALALLAEKQFQGPAQEFMKAHEHELWSNVVDDAVIRRRTSRLFLR